MIDFSLENVARESIIYDLSQAGFGEKMWTDEDGGSVHTDDFEPVMTSSNSQMTGSEA